MNKTFTKISSSKASTENPKRSHFANFWLSQNYSGASGAVLERGAVAVYVALLVVIILSSAAIVLSGTLAVQLRLVTDIISSERAFYAANSGVEEALFQLIKQNRQGESGPVEITEGEVIYSNADIATYETSADTALQSDGRALPCIVSTGEHSGEQRRIRPCPIQDCPEL